MPGKVCRDQGKEATLENAAHSVFATLVHSLVSADGRCEGKSRPHQSHGQSRNKVAFFFKQLGGPRKDVTGRVLDSKVWNAALEPKRRKPS